MSLLRECVVHCAESCACVFSDSISALLIACQWEPLWFHCHDSECWVCLPASHLRKPSGESREEWRLKRLIELRGQCAGSVQIQRLGLSFNIGTVTKDCVGCQDRSLMRSTSTTESLRTPRGLREMGLLDSVQCRARACLPLIPFGCVDHGFPHCS